MNFCQNHWEALKTSILNLGMGDFISKDGKALLENMKEERTTKKTFDPLMAAHNMILERAMATLPSIGVSPLSLFAPDNPVQGCPICYLNWLSLEHDRTCKEPDCKKVKGMTFDDWITGEDNAAKQVLKILEGLPDE